MSTKGPFIPALEPESFERQRTTLRALEELMAAGEQHKLLPPHWELKAPYIKIHVSYGTVAESQYEGWEHILTEGASRLLHRREKREGNPDVIRTAVSNWRGHDAYITVEGSAWMFGDVYRKEA
jgi:hypothetical protein